MRGAPHAPRLDRHGPAAAIEVDALAPVQPHKLVAIERARDPHRRLDTVVAIQDGPRQQGDGQRGGPEGGVDRSHGLQSAADLGAVADHAGHVPDHVVDGERHLIRTASLQQDEPDRETDADAAYPETASSPGSRVRLPTS